MPTLAYSGIHCTYQQCLPINGQGFIALGVVAMVRNFIPSLLECAVYLKLCACRAMVWVVCAKAGGHFVA